jgi:hypothetical protein
VYYYCNLVGESKGEYEMERTDRRKEREARSRANAFPKVIKPLLGAAIKSQTHRDEERRVQPWIIDR